jgi:hypothetical protein
MLGSGIREHLLSAKFFNILISHVIKVRLILAIPASLARVFASLSLPPVVVPISLSS